MSNDEPVLGYLKFSAKGTKREVFGIPIPGSLITADIREASYYQEYQANVAKHRGFLAGEIGSTQDSPAPKPAKPAKKPKSTAQKAHPMPSVSTPPSEDSVSHGQPAPQSRWLCPCLALLEAVDIFLIQPFDSQHLHLQPEVPQQEPLQPLTHPHTLENFWACVDLE
nr:E-beta-farnesene synthase [Tanacetum cinerariifolium]